MTFDEILPTVKQGAGAQRACWRTTVSDPGMMGMVLVLAQPVLEGRTLMPQLLIVSTDGVLRPFAGASWDLLADDWEFVTSYAEPNGQ